LDEASGKRMKQAKASKRNSDELQWNTEEGSIFWFRAPL
jgi:hypothetical protein